MIQLRQRKLLSDNLNVKGPREPSHRRPGSAARAERRDVGVGCVTPTNFDDGTGADRVLGRAPVRTQSRRELWARRERVPPPPPTSGRRRRDAARALFSRFSSSVAADGLELPPPQLHTDGLDAEQVWQQIEMQLEPLLVKAKRALGGSKPTIEAGRRSERRAPLRLPPQWQRSRKRRGGPEWEPFDDGVEYDVDGDEEADASEEETESSEGEEEEKDDRGSGSGKKPPPTSLPSTFQKPGNVQPY